MSAHRSPLLCVLFSVLFWGCEGVNQMAPVQTATASETGASSDGTPGPQSPAGNSPQATDDFVLTSSELTLLPYEARLRKVASVLGVGTEDAALTELKSHKLELGGHDFGANVSQDLRWTAQRMITWIQAVGPVCDDAKMRARYADWSAQLSAFTQAAYGREPAPSDRALLALTEEGLDAQGQWTATCLALMSSAEMVLQ